MRAPFRRRLAAALTTTSSASFQSSIRVAAAAALLVLLNPLSTSAAADDGVSFERDVRPILKTHCFHCHGEESDVRGSLDVRLVRFLQTGGDSGSAIAPGDPDGSLLYQRVRDGEMPPDESQRLSANDVETIRAWIAAGAPTLHPEPESLGNELLITDVERSHWAYQPIRRPDLPTVTATEQIRNPVDAFLLRKLEAEGFTFSPQAAPHILVRRLHIDLHGLPPTPDDLERITSAADLPAALDAEVDRLLDDERYGERWARHWLDVAGYADSEGYNDEDRERPHAWRYRDYVIRSLNADKPFDQFIHEQLAGDELISTPLSNLSDHDVELLTATGFLRTAPDGTGGAVDDRDAAINETIADTIRIVSSSLMGLTVGCAQCHDHRYDPISQQDYYRLRAVFEPALNWKQWQNPRQRQLSLYTDSDREQAAAIEAEAKEVDTRRAEQQAEFIAATFEREVNKLPEDQRALARAARAAKEKDRTPEQNAILKAHPSLNVSAGSLYLYDRKAADKLKAMAEEAAAIRARKPPEGFVRGLTESRDHIPQTCVFIRGDYQQPGDAVEPDGLTVIGMNCDLPEIPGAADGARGSGRRLAFARRLTHPDHPLTARVIVNRVWMHHFGRGLVTTPADFGTLGQPPTHPELLDWLASEFIDSGWSLKHVHRLILRSAAWRQQVRNHPPLQAADPDNRLYGGAELIRLDAEVLRDAMLAVSGLLNDSRGGPPVPVMADPVGRFVIGKENLNAGRPGDVIDMQGEQFRRSIYVQIRRSRPLSVLETFDLPAMTPNCDQRKPSTSATQSLMLMNSQQIIDYAEAFADRVVSEAGDSDADRIRRAWQLAWCRPPEPSELAEAEQFLDDQTEILQSAPTDSDEVNAGERAAAARREALNVLCQMLLSSNEFLYVD